MPQNNGERKYTKTAAERYVRLLGCWTFANPTDALKRRDPYDYRELLYKLIDANKSNRHDQIGAWEIAAAREELKKLGSKLVALKANHWAMMPRLDDSD